MIQQTNIFDRVQDRGLPSRDTTSNFCLGDFYGHSSTTSMLFFDRLPTALIAPYPDCDQALG